MMWPNTSRACVKTPPMNLGNDPIFVMMNFDKMSRRIRWPENKFSHRLSLEPTGVGAVSSAARFTSQFAGGLSGGLNTMSAKEVS